MATRLVAAVALLVVSKAAEEITSWTTGTATLPTDWTYNKGFYSDFDDQIYLLGNANPMVFNPATQTFSEPTLVSGSTSALFYSDYGAVANNVYYYFDHNNDNGNRDYLQAFNPQTMTVNNRFASATNMVEGCITSDGANTLYLVERMNGAFKKVDATTGVQTILQPSSPEVYNKPACAYYDGYVYVLFGEGSAKISKYDVTANTWTTVGQDVPTSISQGDAVVGNDGYIYIGGSGGASGLWKFNPADDTVAVVPAYSVYRKYAGVIFSTYDQRLYIFGGRPPGTGASDTYEYSNSLAPADPCANVDCPDNLVCAAGACQRDCSAFQIDEFLVDCSDRYEDNTVYITTLQGDVVAVNARLNDGGDIDVRLDGIDTEIIDTNARLENGGDVYNSIAATNARLNGGGDVYIQLGEIETSITDVGSAINARLNAGGDIHESIVVTNDRLNDGGDIDVRLDDTTARLDDGGDIDVRLDALHARLNDGGDIESRLDNIEDAIALNTEKLGKYSAQSAGSVANVINDGEGGSSSSVWFSAESKDALIVFLLLLNTVTTIGVCIVCILWSKSKAKYGKYSGVTVYSSDNERQQLQSLSN